MPESDDSNILSRWSRRKLAARDAAASEQAADQAPTAQSDATGPEKDAEAIAARKAELQANREAAEAVDLKTLNEESDFSVFMKDGVPDLLRRQAMAALWRSSPIFANVDRLVDYDDDFGSPKLIMKTLKSAWQVGRGYAKDEKDDIADDAASSAGADPGDADKASGREEEADDQAVTASAADEAKSLSSGSKDVAPETPAQNIPDKESAPSLEPEPPTPRVSLRRRLMLDSDTS